MSNDFFFKWPAQTPCKECGHDATPADIEIGHLGGGWRFLWKAYRNGELTLVTAEQWFAFLRAYVLNGEGIIRHQSSSLRIPFEEFEEMVTRSSARRTVTENVHSGMFTDGAYDYDLQAVLS